MNCIVSGSSKARSRTACATSITSVVCMRTKIPGWRCGPTTTTRVASSGARSEEHTSELQSLMRISYAVFCLKKKSQTGHNFHILHAYIASKKHIRITAYKYPHYTDINCWPHYSLNYQ